MNFCQWQLKEAAVRVGERVVGLTCLLGLCGQAVRSLSSGLALERPPSPQSREQASASFLRL